MNPSDIVKTDQGMCYAVAGGIYTIIIPGTLTQGAYAVIDMLVPPGGGPGPHAHKDIQESFYVVEGEVVFSSDKGSFTAIQGALVHIPQGGAVHCFRNESANHARLICTVAPSGLDAFFSEVGRPVSDMSSERSSEPMNDEERRRIVMIGEKYGQAFFPPDYFDRKKV